MLQVSLEPAALSTELGRGRLALTDQLLNLKVSLSKLGRHAVLPLC